MAEEQCALDADGQLKRTADIAFFNSPSDRTPLPRAISPTPGATSVPVIDLTLGRGLREKRLTKFQDSLEMEHLDEDGRSVKTRSRSSKHASHQPSKKRVKITQDKASRDGEDSSTDADFQASSGGDEETETDADSLSANEDDLITNVEIAELLVSKTIPAGKRTSGKRKRKDIKKGGQKSSGKGDDSVTPGKKGSSTGSSGVVEASSSLSSVSDGGAGKANVATKNPIYAFFEPVTTNVLGNVGDVGDKHWKCLYGPRKTCTIKKSMKSNLGGLVATLKAASPSMYKFYMALKGRVGSGCPMTSEEVLYASGKVPLTDEKLAEYIDQGVTHSIEKAFIRQRAAQSEQFDPAKFNELLAEYIVGSDQPFDEVENPYLKRLLKYAADPAVDLKIPSRTTVKRHITDMSKGRVTNLRKMFQNLQGMVNISLDAWTSSNNIAFLAIVAHYVTNKGELEEILLDFRELIGEHSGENMAEAVWETLQVYGIEHKILAFVMDNASNNDTFVEGISRRANAAGIPFRADWSRLRCMPHTIHLAALRLLVAIGAVSGSDSRKAASRGGHYQTTTAIPLTAEAEDEAAASSSGSDSDSDPPSLSVDTSGSILSSVDKLRKIVRAVRSSPQRKASWLKHVASALQEQPASFSQPGISPDRRPLMLILDVKTRWSSTHQMMARALKYQDQIDAFVGANRDLRGLELATEEWTAIRLISDWLHHFRSATTQMSATKTPMISTIHTIFRSLQDHVKEALVKLPDSADSRIKEGLLAAHRKLSDYYHRFDESPFYTWAALLDPRISYEGLRQDYKDDTDLSEYLEAAKTLMRQHYDGFYAKTPTVAATPASTQAPTGQQPSKSKSGSIEVNFMARYGWRQKKAADELEEYFKMPGEAPDVNPLDWWVNRRGQFPNLYRMACDILSIPCSAVAVERVFSGGRDTISLRRASLNAESISMLMLLKHELRRKYPDDTNSSNEK